ncbi:MAG TPA: hypothetical protein VHE35_09095 [Kofleriaceae bacterium]|nr:hypothetical protein [Kofleriaceae bacterium]
MSTSVAALVAVVGLGACVDAKKRFDEFDDRVPVVDASTVDRPIVPIADINSHDGDGFYLAIKAINFNSTLHLYATWTLVMGDSPTLAGSYQPLSAPPGVDPPPRMPVGNPLASVAVPVDETASFTAPVTGTFDGMANPISGSPLGSQVTLVGTIKSTDLVCGTVTGTVCLGADAPCTATNGATPVEPATFAAVRVTDVTSLPAVDAIMDHCP